MPNPMLEKFKASTVQGGGQRVESCDSGLSRRSASEKASADWAETLALLEPYPGFGKDLELVWGIVCSNS